jgi:hypothetical protein
MGLCQCLSVLPRLARRCHRLNGKGALPHLAAVVALHLHAILSKPEIIAHPWEVPASWLSMWPRARGAQLCTSITGVLIIEHMFCAQSSRSTVAALNIEPRLTLHQQISLLLNDVWAWFIVP